MDLQELNYYYSRFKYGEDNFHDLMKNRIKDVLLISTFYDAYILEQDGRLSEQIMGEFNQLNLTTYPKITNVPSAEMAIEYIANRKEKKMKQFDMVITMPKVGKINYMDFAKKVKSIDNNIFVYLLFHSINDIYLVEKQLKLLSKKSIEQVDELFLWQSDPNIFLAILKNCEDRLNLDYDTKNGLVRVILVSGNNIKVYSKIIPRIYYEIMRQTQRLIDQEKNELNKRLRMRARPKIILTHSMEETFYYYEKYKDYISCLINEFHIENIDSDISFYQKILDDNRLFPIFSYTDSDEVEQKLKQHDIPYNLNKHNSFNKNLTYFLHHSTGFGDFIFRNKQGEVIDNAKSLFDFKQKLENIPEESLEYHSEKNHFSTWLVAHGEIQIAKRIIPLNYNDFPKYCDNYKEKLSFRKFLIKIFQEVIFRKNYGKIVNFDVNLLKNESHILRLADGSFGGKGRGLAFLGALLGAMEQDKTFKDIKVCLPFTAIIGTNEFDSFLESNNLIKDYTLYSDEEIDSMFLSGKLSDDLMRKLALYIKNVTNPLAVRSSGLLEDSQSQPFAGVYRTYLLPNNDRIEEIRLEELVSAVKLVFASIFLKNARNYIESINYKLEEEKMAVIIQQVVGKQRGDIFFPDISGVGQSYNYYPTSYIKHSDGLVSLAVGLGKTVVDREKSMSFCPKYPKVNFFEPYEIVENAQNFFYGIDLFERKLILTNGEDETLKKVKLQQKSLEDFFIQSTSVWDYENNSFNEGIYAKGPRVVTFRMITHYDLLPLSEILSFFLDFGEKAVGAPIELEFALNFNEKPPYKAVFYLLQIRPLMVYNEKVRVDLDSNPKEDYFLYSSSALGNGLIDDIYDIVFLKPDKFDNTKTREMRTEVEYFNNLMKKNDRKYILIGPGRWGSSDPFLGIPIQWSQISNARVIVEVVHKNFNVEASHGSHFFHNVFAMKIGYFTVSFQSEADRLDWEWLLNHQKNEETEHFVHITNNKPFLTKIDGRKGHAGILISKD